VRVGNNMVAHFCAKKRGRLNPSRRFFFVLVKFSTTVCVSLKLFVKNCERSSHILL
jgi:hypothetical protein